MSEPPTALPDKNLADSLARLLSNDVAVDILTPRQQALRADALGILWGIAEGKIRTGQQRLRDDLVEIAALFPEQLGIDQVTNTAVARLNDIVARTASHGFTIEGLELESKHRQSGTWQGRE